VACLVRIRPLLAGQNSKAQIDLTPEAKLRDTRLLFKGRLKFKRSVTWSAGLMYDGPTDEWLVRETGVMIEMPEISRASLCGRSKEGFSLNKIMVGYAGWTQERSTINDATIPILADGIKWLGYAPKIHLLWNVGAIRRLLSEGQGFSTYDNQFVGRVAWLPYLSTDGGRLLHLGINLRYGHPNEGTLKLRSRPESFPSPYFVDTGDFAAKSTRMTSLEAYSRRGSVLIGSEYFFQKVDALNRANPLFHGGEVAATWLITGETRSYNTRGDSSIKCRRRARSSKAAQEVGSSSGECRISISTAAHCKAAASGGSRRWSTGTCPTMSASR
jgi:phosphate-selective porin OprO/OprP